MLCVFNKTLERGVALCIDVYLFSGIYLIICLLLIFCILFICVEMPVANEIR